MNLFLMIALVALHPNPGQHFSQFGKTFEEEDIPYIAFASDNASLKMGQLKALVPLETENVEKAANQIAAVATEVLLDLGPPFSLELAKALKERNIKVIAYVDNYEGCNDLASRIVQVAGRGLFAKDLGYYPLEDIEGIELLRKDSSVKHKFLEDHGLDPTLPTLLFIGSAHKEYEASFKTFLSENREGLKNWNFLLHRHPRAVEQGMEDKAHLLSSDWKSPYAISKWTFDQVMGVADAIGYVQTTTAVKGPLLGIPTFQWGIALKSKQELEAFLAEPPTLSPEEALQLVGYKPNWKARLLEFIKHVQSD